MKMISLVASLVLIASTGLSAILTTEAGSAKVEGIQTAKSGSAHINGQDIALGMIGAGLRSKKVLILNVKVYVAEILASDASKFSRTDAEALKSLELSRTIAIRLNFLRSVEAKKVQVSFRDALTANNVDLNNSAIQDFLKAVSAGGEATEDKSLTIITQKNADATETVFYEDTTGKLTPTQGPAGFSKNVMSIWLGTPADSGVEKLKAQLIQGN